MARSKFPKSKTLNPVEQALHVCSKFDDFKFDIVGPAKVKLTGTLQPSSLHQIYSVEIVYTLGRSPRCRILSPAIDENAPHTFDDNSLCTFYPDSVNWNKSMRLSETVVPWICDWIFQYEIWKVTKKWNGLAHPKHPRRIQNAI